MLTRKAWRDTWCGYTQPIWFLAHCQPDPREVPQVGISGSPCYTPCHALLGLPKHLVIGLDQVVMLGFSSFLGYMTGASGLWDIGYGIWEILPSLWSLGTPWVCHVVCIRAKNPVVVLLRHRSDLRVICCNPSHWSFGSQPFESKRLCDAA